jgi:hypothetical protein
VLSSIELVGWFGWVGFGWLAGGWFWFGWLVGKKERKKRKIEFICTACVHWNIYMKIVLETNFITTSLVILLHILCRLKTFPESDNFLK